MKTTLIQPSQTPTTHDTKTRVKLTIVTILSISERLAIASLTLLSCLTMYYIFSVLFLFFVWCPCMAMQVYGLYAFVEAAAFRSIVLRYAGAPIDTHVSLFFLFVYLAASFFPFCFLFWYNYCRFLLVWRVRRTFFPSGRCFSTL